MGRWSGGCACGAVRFECDGEPLVMLNCHCRDCQQSTGSGYAAIMTMRKSAVHVTGAPRYHRRVGDSGGAVERGFCETCGTPLFGRLERLPDLFLVRAGCLDDPAQFKPAMDIFTDSAHAWDCMDPSLTKHPRSLQR